MREKTCLGLLGMVLIVIFAGCINIPVMPPVKPIEPEPMPQLNISHSVSVLGEFHKTPTKPWEHKVGAYHFWAEYDDMTKGAMDILESIFAANKIEVDNSGGKKLKLSIIDVKVEPGFASNYIAKLKVVAGDNIIKEFNGQQKSHLYGTAWAIKMAITNSVLEMLKNDEILVYLNED